MASKVKEIPKKNYFIVFGLMILVLTACFAFYNVYNISIENKIKKSPLATNEVVIDDLRSASLDLAADTFFVVSYTKDESVYENEKGIFKLLNKYNLMDNVMYLEVTDFMNDENYLDEINDKLGLEGNKKIKKVPAVVFYKDNVAAITIDSTDHLLSSGDFQQIIDSFELAG